MTIRHRDTAYRLLNLTIALGHGTSFNILDVMDEAHWYSATVNGDGPLIIGGALSGALEGLRRCGATPADAPSPPWAM